MFRIIIIVVILVLVLSAFFLPKFRRALWVTLGVVLCIIATIIWLDNRERELDHLSFPLNLVELQNMEAHPGLNARSYVVNGRIFNHSESNPLKQVVFEVIVKDCDEDHCVIVAQEQGRVSMVIPPEQARAFKVTVPFSSPIKLQGQPEWIYKVIDVNDR